MSKIINIKGLKCLYTKSSADCGKKIAYVLFPMDMLSDWIDEASEKYGVTIVVITGMDWQNVFSPWPAPGVPKGTAAFKGESPEFLTLLQHVIIPQIESQLDMPTDVERSLVGISMSGLFALWQWLVCDTFLNIGSLSGSFWYEGFVDWMKSRPIPHKSGKSFFLLGDQESKSTIPEFATVAVKTQEVIALLKDAGIKTEFESVPGNHYVNPIPRLDKAFTALFLS